MNRVHIVFVTFNGLEYTRIATKSLFENTEMPYDLTFVDNGSTDGTVEFLKGMSIPGNIEKFEVIESGKNLGYGGGIMSVEDKFKDYEFVVMANNDLVFTRKWLSNMVNVMDNNPQIALLGPLSPVQWCKHPYSNEDTRKVMGDISEEVSVQQELDEYCFNKPFDQFVEDLLAENNRGLRFFSGPPSHIMGFLLLVRQKDLQEIGPLVRKEFYFGSDDTDLSWRLSLAGKKIAVTSDVYIHHFKHRSFKINKKKHKEIFKKINHKFFNIWGKEIFKFLKKEKKAEVDVNAKMQSEEYYDYWVLRRLNENLGFWKDGELITINK